MARMAPFERLAGGPSVTVTIVKRSDDVRGFVFDVKTGLLREIDPA